MKVKLYVLTASMLLAGCASTAPPSTPQKSYQLDRPVQPLEQSLPRNLNTGTNRTAEIVSAQRITEILQRAHLRPIAVDAQLSQHMLNGLIAGLDPQRIFFTDQDVSEFRSKNVHFAEEFASGGITRLIQNTRELLSIKQNRYEYAKSLLKQPSKVSLKAPSRDSSQSISQNYLIAYWKYKSQQDLAVIEDLPYKHPLTVLQQRYQYQIDKIANLSDFDVFEILAHHYVVAYDPASNYYPARFHTSLIGMGEEAYGVGLKVGSGAKITDVYLSSPAANAGIEAGDELLAIAQSDFDYQDIIGRDPLDILSLLNGALGTKVRLLFEEKTGEIKQVELTRKNIKQQAISVESLKFPDMTQRVAVLKISSFPVDVAQQVASELAGINANEIRGLIIDLRGNEGGSLREATKLAALFLPDAEVFQIRSQTNRVNVERTESTHSLSFEKDIIILTDAKTAGSAELFAAAMQEHGRAILVGHTSYGMGLVKMARKLKRIYDVKDFEFGTLQYSVGQLYRLNGDSFQFKGVKPDILIANQPTKPTPLANAVAWDKIPSRDISKVRDLSEKVQKLRRDFHNEISTAEINGDSLLKLSAEMLNK
ncbi:hypothetical protein K6Y31_00785 [Motilimonas cestriensis]|uniref:PDZ domain-containing protein n=1 Tax=Motilimonas cestriensis TaxID=2742685 RepID=A0ABS8W351_9GAMM|nr:S41 family peptidase [Motilimonas cestriensis]MCE2593354.1 hypothetical protein [Motilimonas cestriensis]